MVTLCGEATTSTWQSRNEIIVEGSFQEDSTTIGPFKANNGCPSEEARPDRAGLLDIVHLSDSAR
jgi:hypothetical protein